MIWRGNLLCRPLFDQTMSTRFDRYRRAVDLRKLGRCIYCIGLAARLTLLCWIVYIVSRLYFHVRLMTLASLVLAISFSGLLFLHGIAYVFLVLRNRKQR